MVAEMISQLKFEKLQDTLLKVMMGNKALENV
jgi:hypothetical protein